MAKRGMLMRTPQRSVGNRNSSSARASDAHARSPSGSRCAACIRIRLTTAATAAALPTLAAISPAALAAPSATGAARGATLIDALTGQKNTIALTQRRRSGRHHLIAFGEAGGHFDEVAIHQPHLDLLEVGDVALPALGGEEHPTVAADVRQRCERDHQHLVAFIDSEVHLCVHPGLQAELRVRYLDFDLTRARRRIEHRRDVSHFAAEFLTR